MQYIYRRIVKGDRDASGSFGQAVTNFLNSQAALGYEVVEIKDSTVYNSGAEDSVSVCIGILMQRYVEDVDDDLTF